MKLVYCLKSAYVNVSRKPNRGTNYLKNPILNNMLDDEEID